MKNEKEYPGGCHYCAGICHHCAEGLIVSIEKVDFDLTTKNFVYDSLPKSCCENEGFSRTRGVTQKMMRKVLGGINQGTPNRFRICTKAMRYAR